MPTTQEVYFSACDRQMEAFIDLAAFRRSMVLSILFQGDLAVTDVFFYITQYIPAVIKSDKTVRNFLSVAIRNGAIIPIFRSEKHTTFRESLDQIRREQIQGIHHDADMICNFLEESIKGKRLHYRLWPKKAVSLGYKQILERTFLTDPTGVTSPLFEQFWTRTKEQRTAVFDRLKPDERGGYRRGDVMNAMHFHVNKSTEQVEDVKTIWANLRDEALVGNIKRLLKWYSYAYQFNQGRMFELSPSLAAMDEIDIEFSRHLAVITKDDEAGHIWNDEFSIPSESALLTVDPGFIFDVRDGATGAAYFEAVENWQRNPGNETAIILLDSLGKYVSELNRLYVAKGRNILNWEWHLKAHIPENKIWNKTALEIAKDGIGEIIPHFGLLSLVGPIGAATYEWWPASSKRHFGINNRVRLEVESQTKRTQSPSTSMTDASFK